MTTYTDKGYRLYGFNNEGKCIINFAYDNETTWRQHAHTIHELCPDWKLSMVDLHNGEVHHLLRTINA